MPYPYLEAVAFVTALTLIGAGAGILWALARPVPCRPPR